MDGDPMLTLPYGFAGIAAAARGLAVSPNRIVAAQKGGRLPGVKTPPAGGRGRPIWIFRYAAVVDALNLAPRRFVLNPILEFCWLCSNCFAACRDCRVVWEWCGKCPPCQELRECAACGARGLLTSADDRPQPDDKIYCLACTASAGWGDTPSPAVMQARAAGVA